MARFYGMIGFLKTVETEGSVWEGDTVEKPYYGEVIRHSIRYASGDKLHDDVKLNNEISIIADTFAYQNYHMMKYVVINGCKWKIDSLTVDRPRIVLSIGGVYNADD